MHRVHLLGRPAFPGRASPDKWGNCSDGGITGFAAYRVITHDYTVGIVVWSDVGKNPVVSTAFAHVFNVSEEFLSVLQGLPQKAENAAGHIRVAYDVVLGTKKFCFAVTRNVHKNAVTVGDDAFSVCFADDELVLAQTDLPVYRRNTRFHVFLPLNRLHGYFSGFGANLPRIVSVIEGVLYPAGSYVSA